MGELRSDFIGREFHLQLFIPLCNFFSYVDPVTAVVPTQDGQTMLVTTLDSHIRLMDMTNGKLLNEFSGHSNESYRCRGTFAHAEASVICGDEKGMIWAWDLLDVRLSFLFVQCLNLRTFILKGKTSSTKSATKSTRQGHHLDRASPHRCRRSDHFQRRRHRQSVATSSGRGLEWQHHNFIQCVVYL